MSPRQIEQLIKNLGQPYKYIQVEGIDIQRLLRAPWPDKGWRTVSPEIGVEMSFWPAMQSFEVLRFHVQPTASSGAVYKGTLPFSFRPDSSQDDVRALFGRPHESQVDQWDLYFMDQDIYPGIKVSFQYGASGEVHCLVFTTANKPQR